MEPPSSAASSPAPRVYVPISNPDSPVPTYAVLQFLGFSESSTQNPNFPQALGVLQLAPSPFAVNPSPEGPCAAGNPYPRNPCDRNPNYCAGNPYTQDPCSGNSSPEGSTAEEKPNPEGFCAAGNRRLCVGSPSPGGPCAAGRPSPQGSCAENPSPEEFCAENSSPQGSCTGIPNPKILCAENPSPRGSCADSSSCSSVSKGVEKKIVSRKPSTMKKSGFAGGGAVSPGSKKSIKSPVLAAAAAVGAAISVSHTSRETIVHTHCSNFREVVHQLTGASSEDTDLLPVTLPARLPVSYGSGDVSGCIYKHEKVVKTEFAGRVPDLGPRKPTTTKLFERRRSSKTLERLSTSCRDLPPLVPSPVTPLTSDFEKICLPVTPTESPGSSMVMSSQERNAIHRTLDQQQYANVQMYPTYSHPAIHMDPTMNQQQTSAVQMYTAMFQPQNTVVQMRPAMRQNLETAEDLAIAGKAFFLHSQRPRNGDPTLLPLFPESPREQ